MLIRWKRLLAVLAIFIVSSAAETLYANPIPTPMLGIAKGDVDIVVYPSREGYNAYVHCSYLVENLYDGSVIMSFPVPPSAEEINVLVDDTPVFWKWTGENYKTEIGNYPLIRWAINDRLGQFELEVFYHQKIAGAAGQWELLYALGTGVLTKPMTRRITMNFRIAVLGNVKSYTAMLGNEIVESGSVSETPFTAQYMFQSDLGAFREDFIFIFNSSHPGMHGLLFFTGKKVYEEGDVVLFTLQNRGTESIHLRSSAPWTIGGLKHGFTTVFVPQALQVVTDVKPGESLSWSWNQKNMSGEQVAPGMYAVLLHADSHYLVAPFIIRRRAEFPGVLNATVRLYPDKASISLDAFLKKAPSEVEAYRNLTARIVAVPHGTRLIGSLYLDGEMRPEHLSNTSLRTISVSAVYGRRGGDGDFTAIFSPSKEKPLESITAKFIAERIGNTSILEIDGNATIDFSEDHLSKEAAATIEMYAAALSTQSGFEKIKKTIEDGANGTFILKNLTLFWDRDECLLRASAKIQMNASVLCRLIFSTPSLILKTRNVPQINVGAEETASISSAGLKMLFDADTGIFDIDLIVMVDGVAAETLEKISNAAISRMMGRFPALSALSGRLGSYKVAIHKKFSFVLSVPENRLQISGVSLQYRDDPAQTPFSLFKDISRISMLPRNVMLKIEAGSNSREEVILKTPSGRETDVILLIENMTALNDVTFEIETNPWRVADYQLYRESLSMGAATYDAVIATNSTLRKLEVEPNRIIINVEGASQQAGALNFVVPKEAFGNVEPNNINVSVDGESVGWLMTETNESCSIFVAYPYYANTIEISWAPLSRGHPITTLMMAALVAVAVVAAILLAVILKKHRR